MPKIKHMKLQVLCSFNPIKPDKSGYTDVLTSFHVEKDSVLVGSINIDPAKIPEELRTDGYKLLESLQELLIPLFLFQRTIEDGYVIDSITKHNEPPNKPALTAEISQSFEWSDLHEQFLSYTSQWLATIKEFSPTDNEQVETITNDFLNGILSCHEALHKFKDLLDSIGT